MVATHAIAGALAATGAACGSPYEPAVEGELRSAHPLEAPIAGGPACMVSAKWDLWRRHEDTVQERTPVAYPDDLVFVVDGRTLEVTGEGGAPRPGEDVGWSHVGEWDQRPADPLPPPMPEWMADEEGRYWDDLYACSHATERTGPCIIDRLVIRNTPCGPATLHGHVDGDRFVLDDGRGFDLLMFEVFGGAMGCFVVGGACASSLPVLVVVGLLLRRRRQKRGQRAPD